MPREFRREVFRESEGFWQNIGAAIVTGSNLVEYQLYECPSCGALVLFGEYEQIGGRRSKRFGEVQSCNCGK